MESEPRSGRVRWRETTTLRLLRTAAAFKGVALLELLSLALRAAANSFPILLVEAFMRTILGAHPADPAATPSGTTAWVAARISDWAPGLAALLGQPAMDPRLSALILVVTTIGIAGLLSAAAAYANEYLSTYLGGLVINRLRQQLMDRVLRLPFAWFARLKVGDLVSRFSTDCQITFHTVQVLLHEVGLQLFTLVAALTVALALNWRLTLCTMVLVPLVAIPLGIAGRKIKARSRRSLVFLGATVEAVMQVLSGLRVVKAFRMEDAESRHYRAVNDQWLDKHASLGRAKSMAKATMVATEGLGLALLLGIGGYLVIEGLWGLTASVLLAFMFALAAIFRALRRMVFGFGLWQESIAAANRIYEVMDTPEERSDPPDALTIGPIRKGIEFRDVCFAYPQEDGDPQAVLDHVSFTIPAGSVVALVGPSGAGKSTVADLIFRFYRPTSGAILIDGKPLESTSRTSLLAQVAVVSQQPFLFNASIRDNIAYGRPGATDEEVRLAARAACIEQDVDALPEGFRTEVGDRGGTLSGGQLQRITVARAILKDASFLLLDEATSNLDSFSEAAMKDALGNLLQGRTALIIAHRLSTVSDADRILVIEKGRIVEQGTHAELIARDGIYARLHRVQSAP